MYSEVNIEMTFPSKFLVANRTLVFWLDFIGSNVFVISVSYVVITTQRQRLRFEMYSLPITERARNSEQIFFHPNNFFLEVRRAYPC